MSASTSSDSDFPEIDSASCCGKITRCHVDVRTHVGGPVHGPVFNRRLRFVDIELQGEVVLKVAAFKRSLTSWEKSNCAARCIASCREVRRDSSRVRAYSDRGC